MVQFELSLGKVAATYESRSVCSLSAVLLKGREWIVVTDHGIMARL
ncbi:MAG TPA: hypothetical protein VKA09_06210 [Nitrososphaeraceae archaeon]|nr:hypothetical protein [Nitrososphaeraceae archaeon]